MRGLRSLSSPCSIDTAAFQDTYDSLRSHLEEALATYLETSLPRGHVVCFQPALVSPEFCGIKSGAPYMRMPKESAPGLRADQVKPKGPASLHSSSASVRRAEDLLGSQAPKARQTV